MAGIDHMNARELSRESVSFFEVCPSPVADCVLVGGFK